MRYVVITTPNCSVCKLYKHAVNTKGLQDIDFVSFQSELGQSLIEKYDIKAGGSVVDMEQGRLLNKEEAQKLFFQRETINLKCKVCGKSPDELEEYIEMGKIEGMTPTEYVLEQEGTLNRETGLFYCTDCYIKIGMPLGKA